VVPRSPAALGTPNEEEQ
jgi:hypothetical protein